MTVAEIWILVLRSAVITVPHPYVRAVPVIVRDAGFLSCVAGGVSDVEVDTLRQIVEGKVISHHRRI